MGWVFLTIFKSMNLRKKKKKKKKKRKREKEREWKGMGGGCSGLTSLLVQVLGTGTDLRMMNHFLRGYNNKL